MTAFFVDKHDRVVRYLRVSITDRCNLSCIYCVDESHYIHHQSILRFEEIERCIRIAVAHGIDKIRMTGGEPFVRKGFPEFLTRLRNEFPMIDLRVTTNGTIIQPHIPLLKELDVKVNLSLDSFVPEKFQGLTGRNLLPNVLESMHAMIEQKIPLKINAVAMNGRNSDELKSFLDLAKNNPVDVRFIEFMPMGEDTIWQKNLYWSADDILKEAREYVNLTAIPREPNSDNGGPARMFSIEGGEGRFGIITPLSSHFCGTCNRLRITSDGKLRTCLFDDHEYDLVGLLREPSTTDEELIEFFRSATAEKQIGSELLEKRKNAVATKRMVTIGG